MALKPSLLGPLLLAPLPAPPTVLVILMREAWQRWLGEEAASADDLLGLLGRIPLS